jgi:hypothetical protein
MQLKLCTKVLVLLKLGMLLSLSNPTIAAPNEGITITPEQCVALTQGQKCYVDATLTWDLTTIGNYCLFSSQQEKPLFCWQQKKKGQFQKEFVATKSIVFTLKAENTQEEKASQQLKVTWVHQKRGQPRTWWRVF